MFYLPLPVSQCQVVICVTPTPNYIRKFRSQPPHDTFCSLCITMQIWRIKTKPTSPKLLHGIITPPFSDGALLAGAHVGMTRNRLADTLNEGLWTEQTDRSSWYDTVVKTLCIIQPGRQRAGAKGSHSKIKRRNSQTREEAETSSPFIISCYIAHNQNTMFGLLLAQCDYRYRN